MLLFAISADLCFSVFINLNEKFISLYVKVLRKSDTMGPRFYKSSYRLKNCHATVSLILCCLR